MKTTQLASLAGLCGLVAAAPTLSAAEAAHAEHRWYFHSGAGINLASDVDVDGGGTLELDLGTHFNAGVGYTITPNIAVEFDTGWIWNSASDFEGSLSHIPFMVNGVYTYVIKDTKWELYAGGGVGGTYSILNIEEPGLGLDDSDGDIGFAWQALAGVRYNFRPNMSLGLGYKYLATTGGDYDIGGGSVSLDNSQNHSFSLTFNLKF